MGSQNLLNTHTLPKYREAQYHLVLLSDPIVWRRKLCEGMGRHNPSFVGSISQMDRTMNGIYIGQLGEQILQRAVRKTVLLSKVEREDQLFAEGSECCLTLGYVPVQRKRTTGHPRRHQQAGDLRLCNLRRDPR
jgi:hypothetical protein